MMREDERLDVSAPTRSGDHISQSQSHNILLSVNFLGVIHLQHATDRWKPRRAIRKGSRFSFRLHLDHATVAVTQRNRHRAFTCFQRGKLHLRVHATRRAGFVRLRLGPFLPFLHCQASTPPEVHPSAHRYAYRRCFIWRCFLRQFRTRSSSRREQSPTPQLRA
jgi:hypothetical protein